MKLSVVISSYNDEETIARCLASVKDLADEIVFVDNSSTDKTQKIAKKFTKNVYVRPNNLMLNVNKNYGFTKAKGEWILNLDGDEEVSEELAREIASAVQQETPVQGYWIPRKNIIFGKWIEHTGWYPDHQLRLFKKGKGRFPEKHVHEMIKVEGKNEKLSSHILHENYPSVSKFLYKHTTIYSPNEAEQLIENGYVFNPMDAIYFPSKEFFSRYFKNEGYKDGFHGLVLSLLMAFYHLIIFVRIWEKQKFKQIDDEELFKETNKAFRKIGFEFEYWRLTVFIEQAKNPLKKLRLKVLRRRTKKKLSD